MTVPAVPAPAGLVWLASYPKSGNTWFRILLANLLAGGDSPRDINAPTPDRIASSRQMIDDWSLLDSSLLRRDDIERLRARVNDALSAESTSATFVKIHDAFTRLADGTPLVGRSGQAAVYLVRDPRDVAVSYAFHVEYSFDEMISFLDKTTASIGSEGMAQTPQHLLDWSGHVTSWLDQADIPVHLVRYEDLLADTATVFARALHALGIRAGDEAVARAVRQADFAELQRQERRDGFVERIGAGLFFREGRSGGWRERLTPAQARRIEDAHGAVMDRLGYERDSTR